MLPSSIRIARPGRILLEAWPYIRRLPTRTSCQWRSREAHDRRSPMAPLGLNAPFPEATGFYPFSRERPLTVPMVTATLPRPARRARVLEHDRNALPVRAVAHAARARNQDQAREARAMRGTWAWRRRAKHGPYQSRDHHARPDHHTEANHQPRHGRRDDTKARQPGHAQAPRMISSTTPGHGGDQDHLQARGRAARRYPKSPCASCRCSRRGWRGARAPRASPGRPGGVGPVFPRALTGAEGDLAPHAASPCRERSCGGPALPMAHVARSEATRIDDPSVHPCPSMPRP